MTPRTVDACAARLHAAGWSAGDGATTAGWFVTAANGENVVQATADTQAEAWRRAVEHAAAVMPPAKGYIVTCLDDV